MENEQKHHLEFEWINKKISKKRRKEVEKELQQIWREVEDEG